MHLNVSIVPSMTSYKNVSASKYKYLEGGGERWPAKPEEPMKVLKEECVIDTFFFPALINGLTDHEAIFLYHKTEWYHPEKFSWSNRSLSKFIQLAIN